MIILTLILPRPAFAVLGVDVFSFFSTVFEGVEEPVAPITNGIVTVFFIYAIGIVLLATSSGLLDIILANPQWLSIKGNGFVEKGFNFTSGLANMLLVLIFLAIAFAIILKIESFQTKKTLPKLIMVALLLNFSLLFIRMGVDVSNILYTSIMENMIQESGSSVLILVLEKVVGNASSVLANLVAWIGALTVGFAVPFVGPFKQMALALGLGLIFLPNILVWVFQIILMFLLSGVLFMIDFFLVCRIFIIQILAILAPLAFLCLILPQTEKYWKQWLQGLVQWLCVGLLVIFFLTLGLLSIDSLIPGGITTTTAPVPYSWLDWFKLDNFFIYYIFLFIYFVIVSWLTKKTAPVMADALIQSATIWGKQAFGMIGEPFAKQIGKPLKEAPMAVGKKIVGQERAEKWATSEIPKGARKITLPLWAVRRELGRQMTVTPIEEGREAFEKGGKKAQEIKTAEMFKSEVQGTPDINEKAGLITAGIAKGGEFKKAAEDILKADNNEAIRLAQQANKIGATSEAKRIGRLFADQENVVSQMGFKFTDEDREKYGTTSKKLIAEAKGDEIKDFSKGFWRSDEAMATIQQFWGGAQISKAADTFGRDFVEDYAKVTRQLSAEDMVRLNPQAALYLSGNAAQDLGFESPEGLSRDRIREGIREARERGEAGIQASGDIENLYRAVHRAGFTAPTPPAPPTQPAPVTEAERRPPGRTGPTGRPAEEQRPSGREEPGGGPSEEPPGRRGAGEEFEEPF